MTIELELEHCCSVCVHCVRCSVCCSVCCSVSNSSSLISYIKWLWYSNQNIVAVCGAVCVAVCVAVCLTPVPWFPTSNDFGTGIRTLLQCECCSVCVAVCVALCLIPVPWNSISNDYGTGIRTLLQCVCCSVCCSECVAVCVAVCLIPVPDFQHQMTMELEIEHFHNNSYRKADVGIIVQTFSKKFSKVSSLLNCLDQHKCWNIENSQKTASHSIAAPEASWRRVFDPYAPLLFDLYHYPEQNNDCGLVPEHAPGPSSQVLPGCRVRHPLGSKKGFVWTWTDRYRSYFWEDLWWWNLTFELGGYIKSDLSTKTALCASISLDLCSVDILSTHLSIWHPQICIQNIHRSVYIISTDLCRPYPQISIYDIHRSVYMISQIYIYNIPDLCT